VLKPAALDADFQEFGLPLVLPSHVFSGWQELWNCGKIGMLHDAY
jgi:hypothetical protein